MFISKQLIVLALLALVVSLALAASANAGRQPTFVPITVEDTFLLGQTSAICGFPVFEHDSGTFTVMVTTLPDGSVKSQRE